MGAYGSLAPAGGTEYPAIRADVYINGAKITHAECLWVEDNIGITPSRAMLRLLPPTLNGEGGYDRSTQWTLTPNWRARDRVKIIADGTTIFLGCLLKRRDVAAQNAVLWEAQDDKWLLSQLWIRGCLVYDSVDNAVKFISRLPMVVNPNGYKNCIGGPTPLGVLPVFSAYAEAGAAYDLSDTDSAAVGAGTGSYWTPLKLLQYACVVANIRAGDVNGTDGDWRSIGYSDRISFPLDAVRISSASSAAMHTKLPPQTFQGGTVLKLICDALEMAGGEYALRLAYDGDISKVEFVQRQTSAKGVTLNMERNGTLTDARSVFDFNIEHDATDVIESVLVDGSSVRVEGEFSFDLTDSASDLEPAWNADEERAFKRIIMGWDEIGDGALPTPDPRVFIYFPRQVPDTSKSQTWAGMGWTLADGSGGKPKITPNTPQAANLARQLLPKVFRGYQINSAKAWTAGKLQGHGSVFSLLASYPYLKNIARPVEPAQLQYYLDASGRLTRQHFPIRVQVNNNGFHDVTAQAGVSIMPDGTILLDGLTDGNGLPADSLYTGDIVNKPEKIQGLVGVTTNAMLRPMKINCVVQLDFRAKASASAADPDITDLSASIGGPTQAYIDSPEGFRVDHQVHSFPAPVLSYAGAVGNQGELNRVLRDDTSKALGHALRRVQQRRRMRKISELLLPGIRPDIRAGTFVNDINCSDIGSVTVKAPIETFLWDFVAQCSRTNGMVTQLATEQGRYQPEQEESSPQPSSVSAGSSQTATPSRGGPSQSEDASKPNYRPTESTTSGKQASGGYQSEDASKPNYRPTESTTSGGRAAQQPSQGGGTRTTPEESARNQKRMADADARQSDAGLRDSITRGSEKPSIRQGADMSTPDASKYAPRDRAQSPTIKTPQAAPDRRATFDAEQRQIAEERQKMQSEHAAENKGGQTAATQTTKRTALNRSDEGVAD